MHRNFPYKFDCYANQVANLGNKEAPYFGLTNYLDRNLMSKLHSGASVKAWHHG